MRRLVPFTFVFMALSLCASFGFAQGNVEPNPVRQVTTQTAADRTPLTNNDIVEMVKAGLSEDVVLAKIRACRCQLGTSTAALAQLKASGVPDTVVVAMIEVSSVAAEAAAANTSPAVPTESRTPDSAGAAGVLFVAQRTSDHVKYSSREVFQGVVDDLLLFLKSNRVPLANAAANQPFLTEDAVSVYTLTDVVKDVGAANLLSVLVDRPHNKWIKLRVMCYEPGGGLLWQEESDAGEWVVGKGPVKGQIEKALRQLEKQLLARINGSQLPVEPAR